MIAVESVPFPMLSRAERRVAVLAVEGLTNPQIAAALGRSVGVVETHLTNAYRKLGVRGRAELAAHAAAG